MSNYRDFDSPRFHLADRELVEELTEWANSDKCPSGFNDTFIWSMHDMLAEKPFMKLSPNQRAALINIYNGFNVSGER